MKNQMKYSSDPRTKFFAVLVLVLVIGGIFFILSDNNGSGSENTGIPKLKIEGNNFDFGDISMQNGLAKHTFTIKNEGDGDLKLSNIITSCMCTTVILDVNGNKSPKFGMPGHGMGPIGWSQIIKPGESANLEATFDPLAHGPEAVGAITREIIITSNSGGMKDAKDSIIFSGNVTK